MIVDFQHHFTPRELIKQDPGDRLILHYDENGAPSYTVHSLLYDLDEHIRMMDLAGIGAGHSSPARPAWQPTWNASKICNDKAKQAERDYPGRFIGAAHANPPGGLEAWCTRLSRRCQREDPVSRASPSRSEAGGAVSSMRRSTRRSGAEAEKLGIIPVFVHPALRLNHSRQFDGYDTARSVSREVLAHHGDHPADQFEGVFDQSLPA